MSNVPRAELTLRWADEGVLPYVVCGKLSSAAGLSSDDCGFGGGLGRGSGLLLAFHFRQTLFESGHEVDHGREFLRPVDLDYLAAFQLRFDQLFQVLLKSVVILFGV